MSVTSLSIVLILISAIAHAFVGAVMKRSADKLVLRGILGATTAIISLPMALTLPFPPGNVWLILLLGVGIHFIYHLAQAAAFTRGDMSVVYPIMRGFAPALTAFFAFIWLKESLSPIEIMGLIIVVCALIGFGWPQKIKIEGTGYAVGFALFCGLLTAIYTVIDTYGIRLAPHKFSFIAWFFVIEGIGISLIVALMRQDGLKAKIKTDWRGGMIAGILGLVTYTTALYAFSLAPIAGLAALRETSVIFGALLATLWLKEAFGVRRIILAIILAIGLILMHMA
jgi:drug/metabolite transporter (DMT)-like permease